METKRYYAYVVPELVETFENELATRDKIKHVECSLTRSEKNEPIYAYIIEVEEGVIDPKWELK